MWTFGMSYRLFLHNSIEQHHYAKPRLGNARSRAMQAIEMARRAWSLANRQRSLLVLHGSAAARTHWPRDLRGSTGATSAVLAPRPSWLAGVALDFGENPAEPKQGCGPTALGLGFFKRHPRACRQM